MGDKGNRTVSLLSVPRHYCRPHTIICLKLLYLSLHRLSTPNWNPISSRIANSASFPISSNPLPSKRPCPQRNPPQQLLCLLSVVKLATGLGSSLDLIWTTPLTWCTTCGCSPFSLRVQCYRNLEFTSMITTTCISWRSGIAKYLIFICNVGSGVELLNIRCFMENLKRQWLPSILWKPISS